MNPTNTMNPNNTNRTLASFIPTPLLYAIASVCVFCAFLAVANQVGGLGFSPFVSLVLVVIGIFGTASFATELKNREKDLQSRKED